MATIREKEIKIGWPHEEGLTARTTTQEGRVMNLKPQGLNGIKSIVLEEDKKGLS